MPKPRSHYKNPNQVNVRLTPELIRKLDSIVEAANSNTSFKIGTHEIPINSKYFYLNRRPAISQCTVVKFLLAKAIDELLPEEQADTVKNLFGEVK